jgi:hypothetical protein
VLSVVLADGENSGDSKNNLHANQLRECFWRHLAQTLGVCIRYRTRAKQFRLERDNNTPAVSESDKMNNQITVQDGTLGSFTDSKGILSGTDTLLGTRRYIAKQAGLSDEDIKEKTTKEVKALAIATGATKEQITNWSKDYQGSRQTFFAASASFLGMIAADSRYRKTVRRSFNKKGESIGWSATVRKEKAPQVATLAAQNAALRAEIAALKALPA